MTVSVVDIEGLLALNPDYAKALARGEPWAIEHTLLCESLNAGEPEGFRRKFDGVPRKWCGVSCTSQEGCVTCTLPEDPSFNWVKIQRELESNPETMARKGVILVTGPVNLDLLSKIEDLIGQAVAAGNKQLEFRITSNGGDCHACDLIYDTIQKAPVDKTVGFVPTRAYSAAAVILQACTWREASPEAGILIHHARYNDVTAKQLRLISDQIASFEALDQRCVARIAARIGRSENDVNLLCCEDRYLTSEEALDFGLIDAIRPKS